MCGGGLCLCASPLELQHPHQGGRGLLQLSSVWILVLLIPHCSSAESIMYKPAEQGWSGGKFHLKGMQKLCVLLKMSPNGFAE